MFVQFMFIERQSPILHKQVYTGAFAILAGTGLHQCWSGVRPSQVRTWVQDTAVPPRADFPPVVLKQNCDCCGRSNRVKRCTMVRSLAVLENGHTETQSKAFYIGNCCLERLANLARVIDLLHACSQVKYNDKARMCVAIERVIDAAQCAVAAMHMQSSGF